MLHFYQVLKQDEQRAKYWKAIQGSDGYLVIIISFTFFSDWGQNKSDNFLFYSF
jgi:hypothetical protein